MGLFNKRTEKDMEINVIDFKSALNKAIEAEETGCLETLRQEMNAMGFHFEDNKNGRINSYETARRYYTKIREMETPLASFDKYLEAELMELPGTQLKFNDKEYFIHGLDHGGAMQFSTKSTKEFISWKAMEYHRPERSEVLYFEQYMDSVFDFEEGYDFGDHKVMTTKDSLKSLYGALIREPIRYLTNLFTKNGRELYNERKESEKDLRLISKAKERSMRYTLPEPLYMSYLRELGKDDYNRLLTQRSKFMAGKMFDDRSKKVHAIVGWGHEDQIAYFLKKWHRKCLKHAEPFWED